VSFIYSVLATLLYLLALPVLMYLSSKPKYKHSIPARFFLKQNPPFAKEGIWFHACSLGEVRSLKPFLEALNAFSLRISTITQTGHKEALQFANVDVRYLPFEIFLPFWMSKQRVLVVLEAELWPLLFVVAKAKGIKTILLNARISDKSYASYQRFSFFYRWIFAHIDVVFAQSERDQQRLHSLGARHCVVNGNIKTLQRYEVTNVYPKSGSKRVIVLASTHEREEALLLDAIDLEENDQLIVAPRHPERFGLVDALLASYAMDRGLSYEKFSHSRRLEADIILCDSMGELINLYAVADLVILGGSFIEGIGGHNPLEPASFGVKLISGPYVFNQYVLFDWVQNALTCKAEALRNVLKNDHVLSPSAIIHRGEIEPILKEIIGHIDGKSI